MCSIKSTGSYDTPASLKHVQEKGTITAWRQFLFYTGDQLGNTIFSPQLLRWIKHSLDAAQGPGYYVKDTAYVQAL